MDPWKAGGAPIIATWGGLNGFAYNEHSKLQKVILLHIQDNLLMWQIPEYHDMPIRRNYFV
jgi:hypothetical protein